MITRKSTLIAKLRDDYQVLMRDGGKWWLDRSGQVDGRLACELLDAGEIIEVSGDSDWSFYRLQADAKT